MSDVMFFGVLRMPYELAMDDEWSRRQFYERAQEAADRVERLEAQVELLEQVEKNLTDLHNIALEECAYKQTVLEAVANLIRVKGRHNTEEAYRRLVDAFDKVTETKT